MILIADSGSTKTDWRLVINDKEILSFSTIGFNPYIIDKLSIIKELKNSDLAEMKNKIEQVFFYGAGCSTNKNNKIVSDALTRFFTSALIHVNHDMLGAARALCGKEEGMVAILGTGSNSCLFNGEDIVENVIALGYILGDYGGGADIGKSLIKAFLEKELPNELVEKFNLKYQLSPQDILVAVYQKELPNSFLASFSQFVYENISHPYLIRLVKNSFALFFEKNICKYTNYKNHKLNLIGSIAFVYQDLLKEVAKGYHLEVGKIIKQPIDELVKFHLENN